MRYLSKVITFGGLLFIIVACTTPPTQTEIAQAAAIPKPQSQEVAEQAVREYFEMSLKDPSSANYKFRPLQSGVVVFNGSNRKSGWFMCGDINAKNSYGGYVGYSRFLAHFSPDNPSQIEYGSMDINVPDRCEQIYGY